MIFTVLWLCAKVFSVKFGAWRSLVWQKRAIHECFLRENRIFQENFLPQKFPTIGIQTYSYSIATCFSVHYRVDSLYIICVKVLMSHIYSPQDVYYMQMHVQP